MNRRGALRALLSLRRFRQLFFTRLTSQTSDGMFQTALAGAVLFNPEHHTGPRQVAAGFVILLLPYSLIGPFAGVFLDRWRRQRALVLGAAVRAVLVLASAVLLVSHGPSGVPFALTALAALAVNRFYLAALSASLPCVVDTDRLVLANALSPTAGTVVTIIGAGIGLALRAIGGGGDRGDALAAIAAAVGYALAALIASRLPRNSLGPNEPSTGPLREQFSGIVEGMLAGAQHLGERRPAANVLSVIFAQRFLFGIWSMMTLLLYRNAFHNEGLLRAGLVGAGQAITAAGVGLVLAAAVTPWVTARIGKRRWIVLVTCVVAVTELVFGAPFTMPLLILSALTLGGALQASKVCADTIVQETVDDEFRGRIFALYDTLFNISFVAASILGAFVLPTDGKSLAALVAMSIGYVVIAVVYTLAEHLSLTSRTRQTS
jgi:MFS family permease